MCKFEESSIAYLNAAPCCPERNFKDDVHLAHSEGVSPGSHFSRIQPLAVDAYMHLQELKRTRNQRVDVLRQEPADGVLSEEDATCSQQQGEHYR